MSVIKVSCKDQTMTVIEAPRIASGGVGENKVLFEFDRKWDGYAKIGVFFNIPYKPFKNVIGEDGFCIVPPEVTAYKGNMYFYVVGVNGDGIIRTSERVSYFIDEGANAPGVELPEPSEDIWQQCIAEIAAAWAAAIAARDAVGKVTGIADEAKEAAGDAIELAGRHASRHAQGAEDPISPESIGAAETVHKHFVSEIKNMPVFDRAYVDEEGTLHVKGFTTGETATLPEMTVGVVETLAAGERATAKIEGTVERPVLNLGIPQGQIGEKGEKGDPGKGLHVLGYYSTLGSLEQNVVGAEIGDAYCVGMDAPYRLYTWDGNEWVDNGIFGEKGDPGVDGTGIKDIKSDVSLESGGANIFTIELTDGRTFGWTVMNGKDGAAGKDGAPGLTWAGEWTPEGDYRAIRNGQVSRDVVMYNGSAYVVAVNNPAPVMGIVPEGDTTGRWELLVSKGDKGDDGSTENIDERLSEIEAELEKINPFKVESFSVNPSVAELGSKVSSVVLSWGLNKDPAKVSIDGTAVAAAKSGSHTVSEEISGTRKFVISAESESGKTASEDVSINFYNGIYYGAAPETIQGTEGLTKVLSNSKKRTFTVTANEGEYIFYILPARLGEPVFKVGGFEGGFNLYTTVDLTNDYGYSESYRVYISTEDGLGNTTVEVS